MKLNDQKMLIFCWGLVVLMVGIFLVYRFYLNNQNNNDVNNQNNLSASGPIANLGKVGDPKSLPHQIELLSNPDGQGYNLFDRTYNYALRLPDNIQVQYTKGTSTDETLLHNKLISSDRVSLVDSKTDKITTIGAGGGFFSNGIHRDPCVSLSAEDGRGMSRHEEKTCEKINNAYGLKWEHGILRGQCPTFSECDGGVGLATETNLGITWTFIRNEYDRNSVNFSYGVSGDDYLEQEKWFDDIITSFKFTQAPGDKLEEKVETYKSSGNSFSFEYKNKFPVFSNKKGKYLYLESLIEGCSSGQGALACLYYSHHNADQFGFFGGGISILETPSNRVENCYKFIDLRENNSVEKKINGYPARYGAYTNMASSEGWNYTIAIRLYGLFINNSCYRIMESVAAKPVYKEEEEEKQRDYLDSIWEELDEVLSTLKFN